MPRTKPATMPWWNPPASMVDPVAATGGPVKPGDWVKAVLDAQGLTAAQRHTALTIAVYANYDDGRDAFPGVARLATDMARDERTVRTSLAWLADHGFLQRASRGGRHSGAAEWHLVLPVPLLLSRRPFRRKGDNGRRPVWPAQVPLHDPWKTDTPEPAYVERSSPSGHPTSRLAGHLDAEGGHLAQHGRASDTGHLPSDLTRTLVNSGVHGSPPPACDE